MSDLKNVAYVHNGILCMDPRNKFMSFAATWKVLQRLLVDV